MKRTSTSLALAFVGAAMAAASSSYVPGEVLVKFRPSGGALSAVYHSNIGATQLDVIPDLNIQRIKLPAGLSVPRAIAYYKSLGTVEYATANDLVYGDATVNDPKYSQQYSAPRMRLPLAWDLTTGLDSVIIAIIDTGVDYNHEDLSGKVIKGHDYVNGDEDPMDDNSHGTHCAGIAAAKTNNGVGIAGMGYNAKILAIKVLSAGGSGSSFDSAAAIKEATDKGADVISLSLGGSAPNPASEDAVNYAWSKGKVVLAAAGNANVSDKHYPAAFEKCIAVGSTDQQDQKSSFSNFGADWVDIAAPGTAILSTIPNNGYAVFDGTSMACPNAAGVTSLLISYAGKGAMSNAEIRDTLERTAVKVGSWLSKGRIDAFASVSQAIKPIIESRGPTSAVLFDGTSATGSAQDMWRNDGTRYTVFSRMVANLGGVAGTEVKYAYNFPANQWINGTLNVRSSAKLGATLTVYLKRNNGVYDLLKSVPVSNGEVTNTFALPANIAPYLSNKSVTLVVRTVLPTRYGTNIYPNAINMAVLDTRTSPRVTP